MSRELVNEHLQEVRQWLRENVRNPDTPNEIEISDVRFDWSRMSGSFTLSLDGSPVLDRFSVWVEITGRVTFAPPMFVSPLGAPASYAAVNLTQRTEEGILQALQEIFPKVRPYGWHKDIDLIIDATTPFQRRILDQADFDAKKSKLERESITVRRRLQDGDALKNA
jgi:hypothetical protein